MECDKRNRLSTELGKYQFLLYIIQRPNTVIDLIDLEYYHYI